MRKQNRQEPFFHIGTSLLLVIFLILCLVTFSVLSLSSAKSDQRMTQKDADHRTEYYTAVSCAEEVLDAVSQALADGASPADDTFSDAVRTYAAAHSNAAGSVEPVADPASSTVSWQIAVGDSQILSVVLEIDGDGEIVITKWCVEDADAWEGDDTLHLMGGELADD